MLISVWSTFKINIFFHMHIIHCIVVSHDDEFVLGLSSLSYYEGDEDSINLVVLTRELLLSTTTVS